MRLDHLMRVGARHPRRHQHLHHQLVARRGGQVRRRAQPGGQRLLAAGRDPEPLLRPVLAGAVGLGQPVALQPAQRLVHLADVQRPHLAGPGLELLAQLQPVLRPLRQQRQQHVRDAHDFTMPDIMSSIILGILTPGNAGFAQPDACGSPLPRRPLRRGLQQAIDQV